MATRGHTPPIKGDDTGSYRILIVGNCGTGKSTLGRQLSTILNLPHIFLDAIRWKPGWKKTPTDEFRNKVRHELDHAILTYGGWIVDGNCETTLKGMVRAEATDVIWLDPPLALYFPRLVIRTFLRFLRLAPPSSPGCYESISETFFSSESILWFCLIRHSAVRAREKDSMNRIGIPIASCAEGYQRQRRLGGWGGELREWLADVQSMQYGRRGTEK